MFVTYKFCDWVVNVVKKLKSNQDHFNEFKIASIDSSNINKFSVVVVIVVAVVVTITPRRKCFQTKKVKISIGIVRHVRLFEKSYLNWNV